MPETTNLAFYKVWGILAGYSFVFLICHLFGSSVDKFLVLYLKLCHANGDAVSISLQSSDHAVPLKNALQLIGFLCIYLALIHFKVML